MEAGKQWLSLPHRSFRRFGPRHRILHIRARTAVTTMNTAINMNMFVEESVPIAVSEDTTPIDPPPAESSNPDGAFLRPLRLKVD